MPTLPPGCELIETMRVIPDGDIPLWPAHYQRLECSATALGFPFDRPALTEVKKKIVIEAEHTSAMSTHTEPRWRADIHDDAALFDT